MFILATPVDFSLPVNSRDSEWIGALFGASSICRGLSWWGDNIYSFWSSGKSGAKVYVRNSDPYDPGLFIRIDPAFVHKRLDYYGNPIGQVWFVIELFGNDPTNDNSSDVRVTYDAVSNNNAVAENGDVALPADKKWKSYVMKMPACYFNQRYEPFVGRSRDISITPLSSIGTWIGVRKVVLLKYEPKVVLTLNCDKDYAPIGDTVQLEALAINSQNQPLEGKEVRFEVVSGSGKMLVGKARTDSSGVAKSKLYVSGSLPITITANIDPGETGEEGVTVGHWNFMDDQQGWTLGSHFSYDSTKGHNGDGAIKFEYTPASIFSWPEDEPDKSLIDNTAYFLWDNSFGHGDNCSIKFTNPRPNATDPNGDGVRELLNNSNFAGNASGWNYNSGEFDYNGTEGHDAAGCIKYKSGDGVNFHQIIDFNAEGIDSSDAPLWVCARAWVKQLSSASGSAYIDLYNSAYDANNSPAVPADGQWHLVAIYDVFNWSTIDPDGTWGNGDELQVRGIRNNGASGDVYFDDFEIEIGWNNPNPSFEYPEYSGGKGGWYWNINCEYSRNNLHFFRQEGSYNGVSPKDGNAFAVVEVLSGATYASLDDLVPLIEPNAKYRVSGWIYRSPDFDGRSYIDVYCQEYGTITGGDPELGFSDLLATSPGWTYVEGEWQAPSDWDNSQMTLLLRCVVDQNPTAGFVCFDNVKIERIDITAASNRLNVGGPLTLNGGDKIILRGWIYRALDQGSSYCDVYSSTASDGPNAEASVYDTWNFVEISWICDNASNNYYVRCVADGNPVGKIWWDDVEVYKHDLPDSNSYITVTVEQNETYKISGWIYRDSDFVGNSYIDIYNNSAADKELGFQDLHVTENGKWVYVEGRWVNIYGVNSIQIRTVADGYPSGKVWFDDIKIEKIERRTEGVTTDTVTVVPTEMVFAGPCSELYRSLNEKGISIFASENWGMAFWHGTEKEAILTRADASNPNSDYLKADVNDAFTEGSGTFYAVVEYQGSVIPDLQYHTSSGTATASVVGIFPSTCDFNYAVYKLVDADLTVSMDVTPDVVVYDKGVQIKIAGLWVSYSWPIPDAPQLEDTMQGVRIKFPESGRWAIYRKNGSTWELLTTYAGTEYIDTSVLRGQTYHYRIARVWGFDIYSPLSSEAEVKATKIMEAYEVRVERSVIKLGSLGVVYVNLGSEMQDVKIYSYSLSGVKVFEKSYRAKGLFKAQLSTGGWTPGVYLVVLEYGERRKILKLIVRR